MKECLCGHPAEDHVTGLCLSTLDCLCTGYQADPAWSVPGDEDPDWTWMPEETGREEETT
jgi:hypothetical protein